MADQPADEPRPVKVRIPTTMRPRATPNAEINAQEADKVRRDAGGGYPLAPNQAYNKGGFVSLDHRKSKMLSCKNC